MFKGAKPNGQPRSLRSIAESKAVGDKMMPEIEVGPSGYQDVQVTSPQGASKSDKDPFK